MIKLILSCVAVALFTTPMVADSEVKLDGVKCVVAPRAAKATKSAEYKKGKVYFCCGNCESKFKKDSKKFAEKANAQLVSTKQYEQKGCPFSGGDVDPDTKVKVGGTEVAFCCGNCKSKVEKADDKTKMKLVFSDKAFDKAFTVAKKKKD
ncbi:MAG: hypothetical protein AAF958_06620 [Planctomycetota bacterium]